ncbi:MAG: hypothetical protein JRD04_12715 [Deltaproteobacteria bacterium]|nr:hypothetical protein [Deltaproteobacteria bacterium]
MEKIMMKLSRFFHQGFHFAVLDLNVGARWCVESNASNIPYLKAENARGNHILLQPLSQPSYLLVDDVPPDILCRHHQQDGKWKPGRMGVETSPGNYQVWIHAHRPICLDEKRYWLKRLKSDPGADPANRWGRSPGFRNRKEKYRTDSDKYPLAKLIWIDWKNTAFIPESGTTTSVQTPTPLTHLPPVGGVCHPLPISRHLYERGDPSATDFAYAIALIRRGADDDFVHHCLMEQRSDWNKHLGEKRKLAYLKKSIRRARHVVNST